MEKFKDCVPCVLSAGEIDRVLETIERIEELGDIRALVDRICPPDSSSGTETVKRCPMYGGA